MAAFRLFDMHCHWDFAPDAAAVADAAAKRGIAAFSATVTPADYRRAVRELGCASNVRVGAGLHPWQVRAADDGVPSCGVVVSADGAAPAGSAASCGVAASGADAPPCDAAVYDDDAEALGEALELFERQVRATRYVGEVGLDFGRSHEATRAAQLVAFDRVAACCAREGGKVLSIHAVRSAGAVLDAIERHGVADGNACVFHWFSGTSEELQRAVRRGCLFSAGPRMLATRRGQAYVRAVPLDRLLLETDEPARAGEDYDADAAALQLEGALDLIAGVRGMPRDELAETVRATSAALLRFA